MDNIIGRDVWLSWIEDWQTHKLRPNLRLRGRIAGVELKRVISHRHTPVVQPLAEQLHLVWMIQPLQRCFFICTPKSMTMRHLSTRKVQKYMISSSLFVLSVPSLLVNL